MEHGQTTTWIGKNNVMETQTFEKKQITCHCTMSFKIFIQMELNFHKTVNSYFLIIQSSLIVHNNMMSKYYLCFFLGHLLVSFVGSISFICDMNH
jgi:hypothetical protein